MNPAAILAVSRFECKRSVTLSRGMGWLTISLFPALLIGLMRFTGASLALQDDFLSVALFFIIVEIVCLLNLLLWAAPVVQSELEGKTWIYLSVRPQGRWAVVLGKYLVAVVWSTFGGWLSVLASLTASGLDGVTGLSSMLGGLVLLSCLSYGALFILIGVLFPKRSMVIVVVYSLLMEGAIASIPALINRLTVRSHLFSIYIEGYLPADIANPYRDIYGSSSIIVSLLSLVIYVGIALGIALFMVKRKEYLMADD